MEQLANRKRRVANLGLEMNEMKELAEIMTCILTDSTLLNRPSKPVGFQTRSLPLVSHERNHCRGKKVIDGSQ